MADIHNKVEHCVYIISAGDHVKIGYAKDPARRLKTLKTGCPELAVLYHFRRFACENAARHVERALHRRFRQYQGRGEWFRITAEVAKSALRGVRVPSDRVLYGSAGMGWKGPTQDEIRSEIDRVFGDKIV